MTHFTKDILSNEENAKKYLIELSKKIEINIPYTNRGNISLKGKELWNFIANNWCEDGHYIIREMFKLSEKYNNGKNANKILEIKIQDFKNIFGEINWGFAQSDYDGFLQRLNNNCDKDDKEKDRIASDAIIKNRRLKEINTLRNDFIEYGIFENNINILPTLSHHKGVDFFIIKDNISQKWDQKVSKSVTTQFQKNYGDTWKDVAIQKPEEVAKYLYQYQDPGRFGADNRILVVYLNDDIDINNIKKTDLILVNPHKIEFEYKHSKTDIKKYNVECFIILLY